MDEKKQAIEKGVKERIKDLESDMVDDMMQAALGLDVEAEIERRLNIAKNLVDEGRIDESASKSVSVYNPSHQKSKKNKNVKF